MSVWRRAFRLFVDDVAFAVAALAWIGFVLALRRAGVAQAAIGMTLTAGFLALFAGGVARAARPKI
jgi:hypothetical protein